MVNLQTWLISPYMPFLTDEAYQHGHIVDHMPLSPPLSERSVPTADYRRLFTLL